jgi:type III secretion system YseE family protein
MKLLLPGTPLVAPPALTALEDLLQGEQAEEARARTLGQLDALEQRLRALLSDGVPPAQYQQLAALRDACQAAREVLTMPKP